MELFLVTLASIFISEDLFVYISSISTTCTTKNNEHKCTVTAISGFIEQVVVRIKFQSIYIIRQPSQFTKLAETLVCYPIPVDMHLSADNYPSELDNCL